MYTLNRKVYNDYSQIYPFGRLGLKGFIMMRFTDAASRGICRRVDETLAPLTILRTRTQDQLKLTLKKMGENEHNDKNV